MYISKIIKRIYTAITFAKFFAVSLIIIIFLFTSGSITPAYSNPGNTLNIHFTDKEQDWIESHPNVNVGFVSELPPLLIVPKNGKYEGILPDYLALLSTHTGINFRIKVSATWEEMLTDGIKRKTDMIGMYLPYKGFTANYNFTRPHHKIQYYIFGPGNINPQEHTIDDLAGKRVGVIGSYRTLREFVKQHQEVNFVSYNNRDDLVNALITGQLDFIINHSLLEYWRQHNRIISFKITGSIPELSSDVVSGVRKDWPELTSIIDKVLSATQAQQNTIVAHWLGYDTNSKTDNTPVKLTEQEKSWITEHPVIRVGFDPLWAPFEFLGENGEPQGLSIQYLHYLGKLLGLNFQLIKNQSWTDALKKLSNAQLDVLPSVSSNYPKRDLYHLTSPYMSFSKGIFSAEYSGYLEGAKDLNGRRVVVVESSSTQAWLKQNYPKIILDSAPDITTALKIVASGKAFALVENHLTVSYYIAQSGLTNIRRVGEVADRQEFTLAVRKDWEILAAILQKGLDAIPQNKRDALYHDWVSINYKQSMDLTLLRNIVSVAFLILVLIIFWNRRLTKEIASRRKIESALTHTKQDAEKANQAKSEFLAHMSHEIRTPMNAIIGAGHLIRQTKLTPEQRDYMDKIATASEALLNVINNILDFSKMEAGMLTLDSTPFNLEETLQKVMSILEPLAIQKGLSIKLTVSPGIPALLKGDTSKLQQILSNLVTNAIKFTKKGSIEISVDRLELNATTISLRFTIKDTGIGISQEHQQKLFNPFVQADSSITREYGGTGLGLKICQQLATLMDGEITMESKVGQGSTFCLLAKFYIATEQNQTKRLAAKKQTIRLSPIPDLLGAKVLLVEDDKLNQWVANKYLVSLGVNVIFAENGKKALAMLEKESLDMVLMDLQLPELDGYGTVRIIRQQNKWSKLPIIAMTAHALSSEHDKCLAVGMDDYLTKPIDPELLKNLLLKWVKPTKNNELHCFAFPSDIKS